MIELHCGDCMDVMRGMAENSASLVLTDPPYGINFVDGGGHSPNNGWRTFYDSENGWERQRPSRAYFDEIIRIAQTVIIWGGNYFTDYLPPSQRWLVWDKGQRKFSLADGELAWTNQDKAVRILSYSRSAMIPERVNHPTQKPVALMLWCLETAAIQKGGIVFDPYMGSGTTGVACVKTGRSFIGVEISEDYFAIAKKRIAEAQMQPRLLP